MDRFNNKLGIVRRGMINNNPTFMLILGMCPTLGTTTSAINGLCMGLATMFVLILSNTIISAVAKFIPDKVRIPCYIVIIASLVSVLQLLMQVYVPALYKTLGIYIPLIVVNCIILGRAEAYAKSHSVGDSALDGLGVGLGFTLALTVLGMVRELLGNLSFFGLKLAHADGMLAFVLAPGAFLVLAYLIVIFRKLTAKIINK
ncbi:MAG: electron transport complex subunit E [Bacteroidales bacterium]|jgi:electron transport complex protein RnfE|nr:electron transport complex subunit E [Bacteroidales bacterium]MCI2146261.1 electron transport complex subunit E [Bacteroidales bacterium]